ncbi:MAG: thermonuclease family protein [Pseudomonadota bacterium]
MSPGRRPALPVPQVLLLLLLLLPSVSSAGEINAHVYNVIDGDSLWVETSRGERLEVRLGGIDAPEYNQPHGMEAKKRLGRLLINQRVRLIELDRDQYHRVVAQLYLGKIDVNATLVEEGNAWVYRHRAAEEPPRLLALERQARRQHRGLWADAKPIPPWKWRRLNKPHPAKGKAD